MNTNKGKVKQEMVDTLPYVATMINGLVHEPDKSKRVKLGLNAMDALIELLEMERERINNERSYIL